MNVWGQVGLVRECAEAPAGATAERVLAALPQQAQRSTHILKSGYATVRAQWVPHSARPPSTPAPVRSPASVHAKSQRPHTPEITTGPPRPDADAQEPCPSLQPLRRPPPPARRPHSSRRAAPRRPRPIPPRACAAAPASAAQAGAGAGAAPERASPRGYARSRRGAALPARPRAARPREALRRRGSASGRSSRELRPKARGASTWLPRHGPRPRWRPRPAQAPVRPRLQHCAHVQRSVRTMRAARRGRRTSGDWNELVVIGRVGARWQVEAPAAGGGRQRGGGMRGAEAGGAGLCGVGAGGGVCSQETRRW